MPSVPIKIPSPDADRIEPHADHAHGGKALLDLFRQLEKVHVARIAFKTKRWRCRPVAYPGLIHVFLAKTVA
jgi:hypothetical protein